jgi:hypothetical protein
MNFLDVNFMTPPKEKQIKDKDPNINVLEQNEDAFQRDKDIKDKTPSTVNNPGVYGPGIPGNLGEPNTRVNPVLQQRIEKVKEDVRQNTHEFSSTLIGKLNNVIKSLEKKGFNNYAERVHNIIQGMR